ncbi:hypothetical protein [Candidatus Nitrosocosmicus franklandus]|uniref:Uncharacterized protein n=1 Tax=Candidatus Nitrosocosmicus franklandianus TaxID=1798806 RepID=A0A484I908_9ARCH|nr:hypothetical protein [Candidatus Nitrosocosmicus franklandus]VFJ13302.1 conserved protein of unknown function [Candidatus Nitrosocosmicus franklandus]
MTQLIGNSELKKYHLDRNDILLSANSGFGIELVGDKTTNETALNIFPNSLFNKKVSLSDNSFVGFMMETTDSKVVVFGDYEQRYDIPKSKAKQVDDNNIIIDMDWNEFVSYKVNSI